jgi:drug/metabolite transporter, DME family
MPARPRARLQLAAAAILFSTGGAAIKAAAFTGWQIASFRSGVAALAILLMTPEARRGWSVRAVLVGFAYAACLTLFVLANRLTTAANTIFLQSTAPLYLLVLGPWLLKEPIRRQDVGFMAAVGLGLALFFVSAEPPVVTAPDPLTGNLLALASGFFWALTVCGLRWMGAADGQHGSPVAAVVSGNVTAFLVSLPMALPVGPHLAVDWAIIGYLGVFQIALAYVLVTSGLRHIPALDASLILLIEPVLNPVWAWVFQGEQPGAWALVGGAIILGSTTLKGWLDARGQRVLVAPEEQVVGRKSQVVGLEP